MSKRTQKDSGEERVTAKSKSMMNLVSRCSARDPNVLASSASESPGKTRDESQFPLSSRTEQHHRTGRPVEDAYSSSYSEWNADKTRSSREWKSDELMEDRTGRPVVFAQHTDKFITENDNMDSYTEAESEMSLESRSLLHRVNDQLRKRQNQSSKDATKDSDKHSVIWGMFMFSTLEASVFMWKNYSDNLHSIKNTGEELTLKKMFEISDQLILEQSDEIFGVSQISWENSPWKQLSLVNDEEVISLSHAKVYVFSDSVLCLGKMTQNPTSNTAWERRWKNIDTLLCRWRYDGNCFSHIYFCQSAQIYGAVSDVCEEDSTFQTRTERPVLAGQSDPQNYWQWHPDFRPMILRKKIHCKSTKNEWKGYHNKIVWLNFVLMQDSWQRLMSDSTSWQKTLKNSHNSQIQWLVVSTLCQEMKNHLTQKVGFEENTKIGPVLEVATSYLQGKYGVEIRIESVSKDNSHSWIRISYGLNKLVTELIDKEYDDNEQETPETKTEVFVFASRSEAKAKPRRPTSACSSTRAVPIRERIWIDIEPGAQFDQA